METSQCRHVFKLALITQASGVLTVQIGMYNKNFFYENGYVEYDPSNKTWKVEGIMRKVDCMGLSFYKDDEEFDSKDELNAFLSKYDMQHGYIRPTITERARLFSGKPYWEVSGFAVRKELMPYKAEGTCPIHITTRM